MKFGVCSGFENADALAQAGFDYIELFVQGCFVPEKPEADFAPILAKIKALPLPALTANGLLPGSLKTTGPDFDMKKLSAYMENACERAARAGLKTLVFGSGASKQVPEGFSRDKALEQLVEFGRMSAEKARKHGVVIAMEVLNKKECNVMTSIAEGARYVRLVDRPQFRLLLDAYHFMFDDNDYAALADAAPLICHTHIATVPSRKAPSLESCDFSRVFKTLKSAGYNGTMSIEGGWNDIKKEALAALEKLREISR